MEIMQPPVVLLPVPSVEKIALKTAV